MSRQVLSSVNLSPMPTQPHLRVRNKFCLNMVNLVTCKTPPEAHLVPENIRVISQPKSESEGSESEFNDRLL